MPLEQIGYQRYWLFALGNKNRRVLTIHHLGLTRRKTFQLLGIHQITSIDRFDELCSLHEIIISRARERLPGHQGMGAMSYGDI